MLLNIGISIGDTLLQAGTLPMDRVDLSDMGFPSNEIDDRLIYLANIGTNEVTIDVRGNDPRTSASDAAVLTLINNGCIILEDIIS